MKIFNKLSVKVAFAAVGVMIVIIGLFTVFFIKSREKQMNEMILQKGIAAARSGSRIMGHLLDSSIDNGFYTVNEITDFRYAPIELPEKIMADYAGVSEKDLASVQRYHYVSGLDSYLENVILEIEDGFLHDPQVKYAALIDLNGYAPVHNTCFNNKITGDFVQDRNLSRSKRIYTDDVAKKAVTNTKDDYLFQIYKRDTGEIMWDISSPVFVKGRHWGSFRVGILIEDVRKIIAALRWTLILTMTILLAVMAFIIVKLTSKMLRPLSILHDGVNQVAKGDLSFSLNVTAKDEIGDLSRAFGRMVVDLKEYINRLKETTMIKERMESELKIAHDIQMGIVPKLFPPFPDKPEVDLYAALAPAREVGGDFFDFFFLDDENLFFVIGDVSDKGVPASLLMAVTVTLLKTTVRELREPELVLERVNREVSHDNQSCMFITVFCGIINIRTGEVRYSNAGHNPPIVINNKEKKARFIESDCSPALGVIETAVYKKHHLKLSPGDGLFLYTDGVTEAFNQRQEAFSCERLEKELSQSKPDMPARALIENIMRLIKDFAQGAPQSDDITVMVIKQLDEKHTV